MTSAQPQASSESTREPGHTKNAHSWEGELAHLESAVQFSEEFHVYLGKHEMDLLSKLYFKISLN